MAEVLAQRALEKPVIPLIPITNSNQYRHAEHDRDYKNKVHTRSSLCLSGPVRSPLCPKHTLHKYTSAVLYKKYSVLCFVPISIGTVKISVLMQAINFSSLTAYILHGVGLGLATPLLSSFFFLDKKCIYLVIECLYNHIKQETFQTRTPISLHTSVARTKTVARAVACYQFILKCK